MMRCVYGLYMCVLMTSGAMGQTLTIQASGDNTLYEGASDVSNGMGQHFFAGQTDNGSIRRGLVRFEDIAQLPADVVITDVRLTLYMSRTSSGNHAVALHRVTSDWGEGTSNASGQEGGGDDAETDDATWLHTFFNTGMWDTLGGDYVADASASVIVGGEDEYYTWSSPELLTDVASMRADPSLNFGWILKGVETVFPTTKRFDTHEHSSPARRPMLEIDYTLVTVPTVSQWGMIGMGVVVLLTGVVILQRRGELAGR